MATETQDWADRRRVERRYDHRLGDLTIPPRYSELEAALEPNVKGVLYGALYSTFVTQALKSAILFVLFIIYISTYLRPKVAAERSKVLNFYWMLVGLVTGVYTFGLAGVLLGPIVIGLLKAIVDTITSTNSWRLLDDEEATGEPAERPA